MAKTFERTGRGRGFLSATMQRGHHGARLGTVKEIVGDGDTVRVSTADNLSIRFLGIDTPELKLPRPGTSQGFVNTDRDTFKTLLADPLSPAHGGAMLGLTAAMADSLAARADGDAAGDHHHYAKMAEDELERLIQDDFDALGTETFFLAFAYDVLDYYGRLLAFVHPHEPRTPSAERRESYNLRLLESGLAYPYFIFPNVDPFLASGSPIAAVALARDPPTILGQAAPLRRAREAVAAARQARLGVFAPDRPNPFEPFELRYLVRRRAPARWLIDLSGEAAVLRPPGAYLDVPRAEDRLWIPAEFVPLFLTAGWSATEPLAIV